MDINFEVTVRNSPTNLQVGKDTFSPEKRMNPATDLVVEVLTEPVNLISRGKQIEEKMTEGESYEDEFQNNSMERIRSCRISQEDIRMFCQGEEELVVPVEPFNEPHPIVEEQIEARENQMHQEAGEVHRMFCQGEDELVVLVEPFNESHRIVEEQTEARENPMHQEAGEVHRMFCQGEEELVVPVEPFNESHPIAEEQIEAREYPMHQEAGEVHKARNSQASVEWIEDGQSYQEECRGHYKSSVDKDKLKEHVEGSVEEYHNNQKLELREYISMEGEKFHVPVTSIFIDLPLESWSLDASSARPKPGL